MSAWLLCSVIESESNRKRKETKSGKRIRIGGILQREKKLGRKERQQPQCVEAVDGGEKRIDLKIF